MERQATPGVFWLAETKDRNDLNAQELLAKQATRKETRKITPSIIDHITHDILNQLTIVCLSCCELQNSIAEKIEPDQLESLKRIVVAVQDAAEKIQQLKRILKAHQPADNNGQFESFSAKQNSKVPSGSLWIA